jgi:hypothetical protein
LIESGQQYDLVQLSAMHSENVFTVIQSFNNMQDPASASVSHQEIVTMSLKHHKILCLGYSLISPHGLNDLSLQGVVANVNMKVPVLFYRNHTCILTAY